MSGCTHSVTFDLIKEHKTSGTIVEITLAFSFKRKSSSACLMLLAFQSYLISLNVKLEQISTAALRRGDTRNCDRQQETGGNFISATVVYIKHR